MLFLGWFTGNGILLGVEFLDVAPFAISRCDVDGEVALQM